MTPKIRCGTYTNCCAEAVESSAPTRHIAARPEPTTREIRVVANLIVTPRMSASTLHEFGLEPPALCATFCLRVGSRFRLGAPDPQVCITDIGSIRPVGPTLLPAAAARSGNGANAQE